MKDRDLKWNAWAPGITSKGEWLEWSLNQREFDSTQNPDVSFIKPMVRRRLSSLAKMVFATSHGLIAEEQEALPLVFASRYGEMEKTVQLLKSLCLEEGLSPTSFGLSVHNSLVGMYGLINKWTQSSSAVGAGNRSLSAGFIEAFSQSKALTSPVLYFYYDEPLPEIYQQFVECDSPPICIGLIVDATNRDLNDLFEFIRIKPEIAPLNLIKYLLNND